MAKFVRTAWKGRPTVDWKLGFEWNRDHSVVGIIIVVVRFAFEHDAPAVADAA
jgi:hypothetical protein